MPTEEDGLTRQTTRQADQRARQSHKRAKRNRRLHWLQATGQRNTRREMHRVELAPWFHSAWQQLAKKIGRGKGLQNEQGNNQGSTQRRGGKEKG